MEKIIKGLETCKSTDKTCSDCPYNGEVCTISLCDDVLSLLKEREAKIEQLNRFVNGFSRDAMPVVRCKECKHGEPGACGDGIDCDGVWHDGDWFCADGERKN